MSSTTKTRIVISSNDTEERRLAAWNKMISDLGMEKAFSGSAIVVDPTTQQSNTVNQPTT